MKWISQAAVIAIHHEQLSQHGGLEGIRDMGLLESALARPQQINLYENASLSKCAAAYAFDLTRNHPFNDGNKRTGFVAAITFLLLNGHYISASETDVVLTITRLAEGNLTESALEKWFDQNIISL